MSTLQPAPQPNPRPFISRPPADDWARMSHYARARWERHHQQLLRAAADPPQDDDLDTEWTEEEKRAAARAVSRWQHQRGPKPTPEQRAAARAHDRDLRAARVARAGGPTKTTLELAVELAHDGRGLNADQVAEACGVKTASLYRTLINACMSDLWRELKRR